MPKQKFDIKQDIFGGQITICKKTVIWVDMKNCLFLHEAKYD